MLATDPDPQVRADAVESLKRHRLRRCGTTSGTRRAVQSYWRGPNTGCTAAVTGQEGATDTVEDDTSNARSGRSFRQMAHPWSMRPIERRSSDAPAA